jgi:multiple sugar transport system substrate-binding protein
MTKKFWLIVTMLLTLSLLAAQCGGSAPAPAEEPAAQEEAAEEPAQEEAAAEAPAAEGEAIELRFWMTQNTAFVQANEELIKRFEASHPNIKVKLESFPYDTFIQTLQTSMPAGTEADVIEMFGTWTCSYAKGGRLAEVPDDVITQSDAEKIFFAAPLQGYTCDGKLYGLPNEFNIENGAVLVNPVMFEEAGLTYPPQWESTEDLLADAQKLTKFDGETMSVSGFHFISGDGLAFQFLAGILQRGGDYMKPDGSGVDFTTPEAKETLEDMKSWITEYNVTDPVLFNTDSNWVGTSFFNNQVAIGFIGPWVVPTGLADFPDMKFDYVPLPNYAGDKHYFAADSGWGKVVSINSQHKEEAMEFAKFMTVDPENARFWNVTTGTVPALKDVANDPSLLNDISWIGPSLKVLDYGRFIGSLPDRDLFWYDIVYPHVLGVLQGTEEVDPALEAIEAETNASFEKQ